jgi:hypothetical protein
LFQLRCLFNIACSSLRCGIGFVVRKLVLCHHFNGLSIFVVYRDDDYSIWVRPLEMFVEDVILENGQSVTRFAYVEEMASGLLINQSEIR